MSAAANFRAALAAERPLQIVGAVNAYTALLAEKAGFRTTFPSDPGSCEAPEGSGWRIEGAEPSHVRLCVCP